MKDEELVEMFQKCSDRYSHSPLAMARAVKPYIEKFRAEAVKEALGIMLDQSPSKAVETPAQPKCDGFWIRVRRAFGK